MAGKGGGAWKVAYADFVTAMMAFFLVMWITAQNQEIKQAVASYFSDPFGWSESGNAARGAPGEKQSGHLLRRTAVAAAAGGAKDSTTKPGRGLAMRGSDPNSVGTVVFFDEQRSALNDEAQARLREVVPLIAGKQYKIEIRGHASRRALAADSQALEAWQLCYERCLATMQFLEQHGIAADRMRLSQAGPFEPYAPADHAESRDRSPRVEVFMLHELVHDASRGASPAPATGSAP